MMLVNAADLKCVKACKGERLGIFKVGRRDDEFEVVHSQVKVKLDKDVLMLIFCEDREGRPHLTYSWLESTRRKFKEDYLSEVLDRSFPEVKEDSSGYETWYTSQVNL
jgi:hypothetical protein